MTESGELKCRIDEKYRKEDIYSDVYVIEEEEDLSMEVTKLEKSLNDNQKNVYECLVRNIKDCIVSFVFGCAGTGKSYLLKTLYMYFKNEKWRVR